MNFKLHSGFNSTLTAVDGSVPIASIEQNKSLQVIRRANSTKKL